ncbi:MAG TPA: hypothetical protein DEO95_01950, partial [Ruminococcaceae bacterium]|nr:hypothetical protein [Oscillospiraceae bacterium]
MQMKKMFGIALAAALVGSMAVVAMPVSAIEYDGEEHTLGIVGSFNSWAEDIAAMTDVDGDGIYEGAYVYTGEETQEFDFKVRADGQWTTSWGVYEFSDSEEDPKDRTQNSQTNCKVTLSTNQKLIVRLDTTKVDDAAAATPGSYVNNEAFDFEVDGLEYWPVSFEVVDVTAEQDIPFETLGFIGEFNEWAEDIAAMTDEDGDGIYVGEYTYTGEETKDFEFKVRADGQWSTSWGVYEFSDDAADPKDRTQNSQTNCKVTLNPNQKLIVKLDTTKVADEAVATPKSYVNKAIFDFNADGVEYWPVSF